MNGFRSGAFAFLVLGSLCAAQSGQSGEAAKGKVPNSLGPYTHLHDVFVKPFLATLGAKPAKREIYCFEDKKHGLYLYGRQDEEHPGRIEMVLLSTFPNCVHLPVIETTIDPNLWKTPEGIGIGSTKEDVLRVYPHPNAFKVGKGATVKYPYEIAGIDLKKSPTPTGDLGFQYGEELELTDFGFSQGKVIWISIHDCE